MSSAAILAAIALAGATPDRLPPIDQCTPDPSFQRFRSELAEIVDRRDTQRLLELVAEDVLVDLGGGVGKKAFVAEWKLDGRQPSGLWSEIRTLLRLGCIKGEGGYLMPSLFEQLGSDGETLETYVAVVPGSALRSEPRAGAPVVATLDWDVLKLQTVSDDVNWYRVSLRDGRNGYVRASEARNPLEHRLLVARVGGKWRITALVAGD